MLLNGDKIFCSCESESLYLLKPWPIWTAPVIEILALSSANVAPKFLTSTAEKGVDAEIPIYTELELELKKPLSVVLSY